MYPQQYPQPGPAWPAGQHQQYQWPRAYPVGQPIFQVRVVKHTGLVVMWQNQRYTVTGNYAYCLAAIRDAQQHNLAAGWWSLTSAVLFNWIALIANYNAKTKLQQSASQIPGMGQTSWQFASTHRAPQYNWQAPAHTAPHYYGQSAPENRAV